VEVESNANPQHNGCHCHDNLISVPNRNAGGINKYLIPRECVHVELQMKTYVRRIINSEAAIEATNKNI